MNDSTMFMHDYLHRSPRPIIVCKHVADNPKIKFVWYPPDNGDHKVGRPPTCQAVCQLCEVLDEPEGGDIACFDCFFAEIWSLK